MLRVRKLFFVFLCLLLDSRRVSPRPATISGTVKSTKGPRPQASPGAPWMPTPIAPRSTAARSERDAGARRRQHRGQHLRSREERSCRTSSGRRPSSRSSWTSGAAGTSRTSWA